ncbi:MAG: hypothetical protein IKR92_01580 [Alphaproteobacteria bacterium]|nr:hypothetical protein [Alphaproteobacteria bacterium]
MNTLFIILFVLCVLGFSIPAAVSPTAQTYLRDQNPRIQNWNHVLFGFAVLLANFIRLPLMTMSLLTIWAANFFFCLLAGAFLFAVVQIIGVTYRYSHGETCA